MHIEQAKSQTALLESCNERIFFAGAKELESKLGLAKSIIRGSLSHLRELFVVSWHTVNVLTEGVYRKSLIDFKNNLQTRLAPVYDTAADGDDCPNKLTRHS